VAACVTRPARCHAWITGVAAAHEKGPGNVYFLLAAIFFGAMGMFAGAAALHLTSTPVNRLLFGHRAAEIVLFCLLAIALSSVIATLGPTIWTWISR
jgi:hypothetical protein